MTIAQELPSTVGPLKPEVQDQIKHLVAASPAPLSPSQLLKKIRARPKPSEHDLVVGLEALAGAGTIHPYPPAKRTLKHPRYWGRPVQEVIAEALLQRLDGQSLPWAEAIKPARKLAPDDQIRPVFDRLNREQRIFAHPPLGKARTPRYGTRPADPTPYVADALKALDDKLSRLDFAVETIHACLRRLLGPGLPADVPSPPRDLSMLILDRIRQLKPDAEWGATVLVPELRRAVGAQVPSRADFDRLLIDMDRRGLIHLQSHNDPARLAPEEAAQFIANGRGSYYIAVGIRSGR